MTHDWAWQTVLGEQIPVPHGWELLPGAAQDTAGVVARHGWLVQPSVIVTRERLESEGLGWQEDAEHVLKNVLNEFVLLNFESRDSHARRLAHHVANDGAAVAIAQWCVDRAGIGVTITMSASPLQWRSLEYLRQALDVHHGWAVAS